MGRRHPLSDDQIVPPHPGKSHSSHPLPQNFISASCKGLQLHDFYLADYQRRHRTTTTKERPETLVILDAISGPTLSLRCTSTSSLIAHNKLSPRVAFLRSKLLKMIRQAPPASSASQSYTDCCIYIDAEMPASSKFLARMCSIFSDP